jgi:hypothetical protein
MDVEELRDAVRRNVAELRQTLAKEEAFLAELEARVPRERRPLREAMKQRANGQPEPQQAPEPPIVLRQLSRGDKTKLALAYIDQRPGRWTTAQMRAALEHSGVDPEAGTPVKNILWHIAKSGRGESAGHGAYDFPAASDSPGKSSPTQEALS